MMQSLKNVTFALQLRRTRGENVLVLKTRRLLSVSDTHAPMMSYRSQKSMPPGEQFVWKSMWNNKRAVRESRIDKNERLTM